MKKQSEQPFYKYGRFWEYSIAGLSGGWVIRGWFPEQNLIELVGEANIYIIQTVNALGGLPVVVAAIVAIVGLIKRTKRG